MADNRYVLTRIWRDEWFSELPHDAKVYWFYLLTNPAASVCGMFRLPDKFAAFDTGLQLERLREIKEQFRQAGKIEFEGDIIWVRKMRNYNYNTSPKIAACALKDLQAIPASEIRDIYMRTYHIDSPSIPYFLSEDQTKPNQTKPNQDKHKPNPPPNSGAKAPGGDAFHKSQQSFIDKFCNLTGIPEPDHKLKQFAVLWGGSSARVIKMLDGQAEHYLERAIAEMRQKGLTISTPKSIENIIMALYGEDHSSLGKRVFNDD